MKKVIIVIVLLFIAVFFGLFIQQDPGYVLIAYRYWNIETSLWIALAILIGSFVLFYLSIRAFQHAKNLANNVKKWNRGKQQEKSIQLTNIGVCELIEGDYRKAEKYLVKAAEKHRHELINYLVAAIAAQFAKRFHQRDFYLKKAHDSFPASRFAVSLMQARLQIESGQREQALAILKDLQEENSRHPYVLRSLQMIYEEFKEWSTLEKILPALKKWKALNNDELNQLERKVYQELLGSVSSNSLKELSQMWQKIPKSLQRETTLMTAYLSLLLKGRHFSEAISLLKQALKREWRVELVEVYNSIPVKNLNEHLTLLESWLKEHPTDPQLLFLLGRLYCHDHQFQVAKEYLEKSVNLLAQPHAYQLLGFVEEQLGEKDAALLAYQKGLEETIKK